MSTDRKKCCRLNLDVQKQQRKTLPKYGNLMELCNTGVITKLKLYHLFYKDLKY